MGSAEDAEGVVLEFCNAFARHDAEALRPYLSEDVVYHNMPLEPVVGIDATVAFIAGFFGMCDGLEFEIVNVATRGDVVLTERIDTFRVKQVRGPLPVMGTFEVRDGKISAWRDYFDLAQATKVLSGES
jgi:limonene-1,2-epoxide hydrolase